MSGSPLRLPARAMLDAGAAREVLRAGAVLAVAFGVVACGSAPIQPDAAATASSASDSATTRPLADGATAGSPQEAASPGTGLSSGAGAAGTAVPPAPVPARALADFNRAVGLMKAGNAGEAELEFKQLAVGYPQLVGAQVNLALLQRKANRLDDAEATLKAATASNPGSALAWSELGLTQRMKGGFQDAAGSYEKALAADPNYAPAHRNYAVLLDLYLGDPERALTALERYKELTGEDKPVTGWIAELRQRTGKRNPPPAPAAAPEGEAAPAAPADGQPPTEESKPAEAPTPRVGASFSPAWASPIKGA